MLKVLVADDEMPIRQWLEFCLNKMEHYEVVGTASNGAEGYSMFCKTNPDILITDIRMPGMDGLEMMEMIRNINPSVYTIMLTSHEDFEYARKAMKLGAAEYVLKTEISDKVLEEILGKAELAIRESRKLGDGTEFESISNRNHYLRSLVLKNQGGTVSEQVLREYGVPLQKKPYIAVDVKTREENAHVVLPEDGILENMVKFPLDLYHTILIGNLADHSGSVMKQQENSRSYCMKILEKTDAVVGISDIYDQRVRLVDAMTQAYRRTMFSFYYPKERLFYTQNTDIGRLKQGEWYKMQFSRELVSQNYASAIKIKDEMTAQTAREKPADIGYVKKMYLFFITSLLHTTKEDAQKVESSLADVWQIFNGCYTLEELDRAMQDAFARYGYADGKQREYSFSVRSAIAYLEANYAKQVALPEVAAHVGLSAEYLSRLFKEETGVKFVVYLNNLRLKHALHLLESTNRKVYEVAEAVGYSNLSYFSTVFKKNFGLNPFDYKNNVGKEQQDQGESL